jgi:hypothetical protein
MPRLQRMNCAFLWAAGIVAWLATASGTSPAAGSPWESDVRQLRVGAKLDDRSAAGLTRFSCAGNGALTLAGWSDYRRCPADAEGLREIRFEFKDEKALAEIGDRWQGTKIAGHPVVLTLTVNDGGIIEGLRIATDPEARHYLKKKAFLLSLQVRQHYGPEGWTCADLPRQPGETEIGGMFIKQDCQKTVDERRVRMQTRLLRGAGQRGEAYESSVIVEVQRASRSTHR